MTATQNTLAYHYEVRFKISSLCLYTSRITAMLNEQKGSHTTIRQDRLLYAAAKMAGAGVPFIHDYFKKKLWLVHVPSVRQVAKLKAFGDHFGTRAGAELKENLQEQQRQDRAGSKSTTEKGI